MENETNEKFKSVHRTFTYTPKSALTNQLSSLAFGIGMIVVPLILLPSGILSTILIVGGALLLIMTFFDIRKARVLAAQGGVHHYRPRASDLSENNQRQSQL